MPWLILDYCKFSSFLNSFLLLLSDDSIPVPMMNPMHLTHSYAKCHLGGTVDSSYWQVHIDSMTSHIDDTAEKIAIHKFNHRYFQQRVFFCMGYLPYELIPQIIEEGFSQFLPPQFCNCVFFSLWRFGNSLFTRASRTSKFLCLAICWLELLVYF